VHRLAQYAPYAHATLGGKARRHFAHELAVSYAWSLLVSLHLGHRPEGLARGADLLHRGLYRVQGLGFRV
jgi:hypothetical protein